MTARHLAYLFPIAVFLAAAHGTASGMFTAKGVTFVFARAAAFVDQTDKAKRVVLVLSEQPVPVAAW